MQTARYRHGAHLFGRLSRCVAESTCPAPTGPADAVCTAVVSDARLEYFPSRYHRTCLAAATSRAQRPTSFLRYPRPARMECNPIEPRGAAITHGRRNCALRRYAAAVLRYDWALQGFGGPRLAD